jgi:HD-GYP domain-containing protein (c-di-GMP phosphodiesterase class II)/response regulator of citrate/malate metabolism
MANVIVWGKTRELLSGSLPAGASTREVDTLDDLKANVDDARGTLVIVDPVHLDAEGAALSSWLRDGGRRHVLVVAVSDANEGDAVLQRHGYIDDILIRPVTATRIRLRLDQAMDAIHNRRVIAQLDGALKRKSAEVRELNRIGVALSAERDINKLLELILVKTREITAADAGSLYLVERGADSGATNDDQLKFELAQNDSLGPQQFEKKAMPLDGTSIAGYVALTGQPVNVADAYNLPSDSTFQISRAFDQRSGYRTKSVLVVPMKDHQDKVVGVVQLINKKRDPTTVLKPVSLVDEAVIPFTSVDQALVTSLASQAAVAFENTLLIQDIRNLFNSFVQASVTAIESRDPTTSGHSDRVATLTVSIAEKVDALEGEPFRSVRFTPDQIQEIRYASLLHDFGKVGVREKVLIKGKKLYVGEMLVIRQRIAYIKRTLEAEYLRTKLEQMQAGRASQVLLAQMDRDYEARRDELDSLLKTIVQANEPSILEEESFRALMDLPSRTFTDIDGNRQPFLTPNEVSALSIRRGSLSDKERREIESHVTHTFKFLSQIPWTGEFCRVPEIAYAHHEKLDGTGYPRRLTGVEIPIQSKMMTISDIFDALVAWDRPYKKSVPIERALDILNEEASHGKLDTDLLQVFIEAKIYEKTLPRTGAEAQVAR